MTAFILSDEEWRFLYDEPAEVLKIYCALRRVMDFSTGLAGQATRINEAFFFEVLLVARIRGRTGVKPPTRKQWRNILDRLATIKLIEPLGSFVFRLPLALKNSCAQNIRGQTRANQGTDAAPPTGQTGFEKGHCKNNHLDDVSPGGTGQVSDEEVFDEVANRGLPQISELGEETSRAYAREEVEGDEAPPGVSTREAVAVFKQALGGAYRPDARFVRAAGRLHELTGTRAVSASEIRVAVGDALARQGVRDPAAYAMTTLESGSLLIKRSASERPKRAACGRSAEKGQGAVLSFLNRKFGVAP